MNSAILHDFLLTRRLLRRQGQDRVWRDLIVSMGYDGCFSRIGSRQLDHKHGEGVLFLQVDDDGLKTRAGCPTIMLHELVCSVTSEILDVPTELIPLVSVSVQV
jgi:hypothetical protein